MPAKLDQRVDALEEQIEALTKKQGSDIAAVKTEIQKAISEQKAAIEPQITDAAGKGTQAAADAESRVTVAVGELRTNMGGRVEKIEKEIESSLKKLEQKLEKMLKDGDQAVTSTTIALGERLVADAERRVQECREEFLKNVEEIQTSMNSLKAASSGGMEETYTLLDECKKTAKADLEAASTKHEKMMVDLTTRIDEERKDASENRDKIQKELREKIESTSTNLKTDVKESIGKLESQTLSQMAAIAQDVGVQITDIRNTVKGAQNTHTRAVTWKITNFRNKLQQLLSSEGQSIWSPDFSLCATPQMALQLQVSAPPDHNPTPIAPPHRKVLPIPGMCSLHLWGEPGMKVIFRIALGEGGHNSKRFEHSFDLTKPGEEPTFIEEGASELPKRVPFFMPNLNTLDRIWNEQNDTLTVCFELLELKYMICRQEKVAPVEAQSANAQDVPANLGDTEKMVLYRQVAADALMTDRVNREIQVVKNRSVRRVEWEVDGCIGLYKYCSVGESVDSAIFSAAGLERVQLHFYPKGLNSDSQGNCSLFISCGRHTFLRCQLSVGKQSRAIEHYFERSGEVYGKGRFGAMDAEVSGDRLMIAMDIHEAHVEQVDKGQLRGPGDGRGAGAVMSVLRLKKADQASVDEVLKCASLPAIGGSKKMPRIASQPQMAKTHG